MILWLRALDSLFLHDMESLRTWHLCWWCEKWLVLCWFLILAVASKPQNAACFFGRSTCPHGRLKPWRSLAEVSARRWPWAVEALHELCLLAAKKLLAAQSPPCGAVLSREACHCCVGRSKSAAKPILTRWKVMEVICAQCAFLLSRWKWPSPRMDTWNMHLTCCTMRRWRCWWNYLTRWRCWLHWSHKTCLLSFLLAGAFIWLWGFGNRTIFMVSVASF